jgi:hypothetical protein
MNGRSRFSDLKWPENIYQDSCFYKTTIQDRFLISKTILRHQNYNLHLGIDVLDKSEVIVMSIQVIIFLFRSESI